MPRLLMLANHFVDHGGGLEIMADELARQLAGYPQFAVTLAAHGAASQGLPYDTLELPLSDRIERLTGLPIMLPGPSDLAELREAVREADCLILHDNVYLGHLFAQRVAHKAGIPVLLIKHTGWLQDRSSFVQFAQSIANTLILSRSMEHADRVVAVTQAKKENINERLPDLSIEVVENGIDTSFFDLADEPKDIDVLFVGRFVAKKGIDLIAKLAARRKDLRFACLGFGPLEPDTMKLPNIEVVHRPSRTEIRRAYRRARLCLAPVLSEGTPLTVLESLACGTRVLVSEQAAHPMLSYITSIPIDLQWPAQIVDIWDQQISYHLTQESDPPLLRDQIVKHFSTQNMGRRYATIIEDLLARR